MPPNYLNLGKKDKRKGGRAQFICSESWSLNWPHVYFDFCFFNRFIKDAVFLSKTLRGTFFPGGQKDFGGRQGHFIGRLNCVFKTSPLPIPPSLAMASQTGFLHGDFSFLF